MLNVEIPEGKPEEHDWYTGGIGTKGELLHGDLDVQLDFGLSPEYHSTPNCNTILLLTDGFNNCISISIRSHPSGHKRPLDFCSAVEISGYASRKPTAFSPRIKILIILGLSSIGIGIGGYIIAFMI